MEWKKILSNNIYFFKDVWRFSKSYVIAQSLTALIGGLSPLLYIILPKMVIDGIQFGKNIQIIVLYIGIFAVSELLIIAVRNYLKNRFINLNGHLYAMHFLLQINQKSASLDLKQLDSSSTHQKQALAQDIIYKGIGIDLIMGLFQAISGIVVVISTTIILASASWIFVLIIVISAAISVVLSLAAENWQIKQRDENIYITRVLNYFISSMGDKNHTKEMKLFGFKNWLNNKYQDTLVGLKNRLKSLYSVNMWLNFWGEFVDWIKGNGIYFFLAIATFRGRYSIGQFTQYFSATGQLSSSLLTVIDFIIKININGKYIESYREFMELESEWQNRKNTKKLPLNSMPLSLRFDRVSFNYPGSETLVLRDLSYTFEQGKTYVLVGENGAGKSTLINILCGLYEPTEGQILINNSPVAEINIEEYRRLFSVVFQDFKHFSFTVGENVGLNMAFSEEKIKVETIISALEKSGFSAKLNELPLGINTPLDKIFTDDGVRLSGGESQKLALARSLIRDTPVMLLDEPSSALDPIAEDELLSRFSEISQGKLVIYISHRLTCAAGADMVLYLKNGHIQESGSHKMLLQQGGEYADFYQTQSKYYQETSGKSFEEL